MRHLDAGIERDLGRRLPQCRASHAVAVLAAEGLAVVVGRVKSVVRISLRAEAETEDALDEWAAHARVRGVAIVRRYLDTHARIEALEVGAARDVLDRSVEGAASIK